MATGHYLGEFEQIVLLAVTRLEDEAYGTTIRREITDNIGRAVSIGALYATLDRLAAKGHLETRLGEATAIRGGRAKRYFYLTPIGAKALEASRERQTKMWAGVNLRRVLKKS